MNGNAQPEGEFMTETHNPLVGASMWERDLYDHLSTHADTERVLLEEYTAAAKKTESKALEYLVNLLIEDEIRHHRYFEQLAESLKASAELRSDDLPVPMVDFHQVDASAVFEVSDRLLKKEREDAQELKRLQRELRDVKDTTLWSLLVDVMRHDTDKHIAILEFVEKHAR
jgi:hydroxymethylpyrimidine pyrophosphatase-like HAD family hydrolase